MTPNRNGDANSIKLKQSTLKMMPENIPTKGNEDASAFVSGDPSVMMSDLLKENEALKS